MAEHDMEDLHRLRLIKFNRENKYRVYKNGSLLGMAVDPIAAVVSAKVHMFNHRMWGSYRVIDDRTESVVERGFIRRIYDTKKEEKPWILFHNWP